MYKLSNIIWFLILSTLSTQLYIISEETLVVISFILFILLTYNTLSEMIVIELDQRSDLILKQFEFAITVQKEAILLLMKYYIKQVEWITIIMNFILYIQTEIIQQLLLRNELELQKRIKWQIKRKLDQIVIQEQKIWNQLQQKIIESSHHQILKTILETPGLRQMIVNQELDNLLTHFNTKLDNSTQWDNTKWSHTKLDQINLLSVYLGINHQWLLSIKN